MSTNINAYIQEFHLDAHNDSSSSQITVVVQGIHAEFSVTSDDETGLTLFHVDIDRELASTYMDIFIGVGNQQILYTATIPVNGLHHTIATRCNWSQDEFRFRFTVRAL
jgi:hypothetical protein